MNHQHSFFLDVTKAGYY